MKAVYTRYVATETWPVQAGWTIFGAMMRKQRGRAGTSTGTSSTSAAATRGSCAVCGMSDARGLVEVDLAGEPCVTLCGSHELMHRRSGWKAQTASELRAAFGDRRGTDRRGGRGDVDELAESLTAAFTRDRRTSSRRAS